MKNTALTGSKSSSWWDSLPASPAGMQRVLVLLEISGQGKRDKSQLGAAGKTCPCWSSRGFKLTMTPQLEYHPKQVSNRGTSHCHHLFGKHNSQSLAGPGLTAVLHVPKVCGDKKGWSNLRTCLCHLCLCLALLQFIDTELGFSSEHIFLGRVSSPTEIPPPPLWTWSWRRRHISVLPPKSVCAATAYLTFQPMISGEDTALN